MEKALHLDAVATLADSKLISGNNGLPQAVRQFNALLSKAHELYPSRPDICAMEVYEHIEYVPSLEFQDAAQRLREAIELRRPGTVTDIVDSIRLPLDSAVHLVADLQEFKEAVGLGLKKTPLLLAGSIAEALLLTRHSDSSERGPGLARLLTLAQEQRLFGRDTLRQLETLNDYRDLIHTRAGPRNRIQLNDSRVVHAAQALKLLCSELEEINVRYQ